MNRYRPEAFLNEANARAFVAECDRRLAAAMHLVARAVAKTPALRVVGLTGPTCSGKTTAARKLTDYLETHGHRVHVISLDDFFYDTAFLNDRAGAESGAEIDYDSEEVLDIELLQKTMDSLRRGDPTTLPRFDFRTGLRAKGVTVDPDVGDVFLVEGIQVLYPRVDAILAGEGYTSIYIAPASEIEVGGEVFAPNEIRLMRRLVRDFRYRSADAAFTFYLWQSVRANEEKSIFPNAHRCCHVIDSTLPYEIGMLKPYLADVLSKMDPASRYLPAGREILSRLTRVDPVDAAYMTEKSLYKEFI